MSAARGRSSACLLAVVVLLAPTVAMTATLDVKHSTLEKLLSDPSRPDGRKYLNGGDGDACDWTYVRAPQVVATGNRLRLSARVRAAFRLPGLGSCVTLPQEVPVQILARPVFRNGALALDQPEIQVGQGGADEITGALLEGLVALVRLDVRERLAAVLRPPAQPGAVGVRLLDFTVLGVRVTQDSTRLDVSFQLEMW